MKNLIYFIANDAYENVLQYNLQHLRANLNKSADVCCITPTNCNINTDRFPLLNGVCKLKHFDYRYNAKFLIKEWPEHSLYDNFLYIDVDAIPVKDVSVLFSEIENQPAFVHGVIENDCLNSRDHYHRFSGKLFLNDSPAYNAGTFGFNKQLLSKIDEFNGFIQQNRNNAHLDQSLYNEFFTQEKNIIPTLSKYVYLFNQDNIYKDINKITITSASIIHFLGNAYAGKCVTTIDNVLKRNNII